MASWKRILDLTPEFGKAEEGEIEIHDLARITAERLRQMKPFFDFMDVGRVEIAEQFDDLSQDKGADVDDFDTLMEELYNWADVDRSCWVKTF